MVVVRKDECYHFQVFLAVWVLFSYVFTQVNEWLISELRKLIRVSKVVACPILFILFHERGWQGGVFKVIKNDHVFAVLAVWVIFHLFLGR